jgi:hypothetical protein
VSRISWMASCWGHSDLERTRAWSSSRSCCYLTSWSIQCKDSLSHCATCSKIKSRNVTYPRLCSGRVVKVMDWRTVDCICGSARFRHWFIKTCRSSARSCVLTCLSQQEIIGEGSRTLVGRIRISRSLLICHFCYKRETIGAWVRNLNSCAKLNYHWTCLCGVSSSCKAWRGDYAITV